MPLIYGHSKDQTSNESYDVYQYTKWFDLMNMDFELRHIGNSWVCNAWSREKNSTLQSSSGTKETVSQALQQCYSDIRILTR